MLIRSKNTKLIHFIGFTQVGRGNFIAFRHLASKKGNVGYDPPVVVKCGIKHQGFEGILLSSSGPLMGRKEKHKLC